MASQDEREIRDAVAAHLRQSLPAARIIHELVVGGCRADIAAIEPQRITLVELKSCKDKMQRAPKQIETFKRHSHATILVADQCHFDRTSYNNGLPRVASTDEMEGADAVWIYPRAAAAETPMHDLYGRWGLYDGWRGGVKRPLAAQPLLSMLWRSELLAEGMRHCIIAAHTKADMWTISSEMAWMMTGREVVEAVCRQLRARPFPEADEPIIEAAQIAAWRSRA